jgi:hypothetical protein
MLARALLDGEDTQILDRMQVEMQEAADQQEFERAASMRDAWEELSHLLEQIDTVREVTRYYWFIYPISDQTKKPLWVFIAGGDVAAVRRAPYDRGTAYKALQQVDSIFGNDRQMSSHELRDYEHVRMVASWFRQHPDEIDRVLSPEDARRLCAKYCPLA